MKINRLIFALIGFLAYAAIAQATVVGESETEWDEETLQRLYTSATEKENPEAMYLLGTLFDQGIGVSQNYKEAFKWYQHAADRGQAEAMNCLGILYTVGHGMPQDYAEALSWYLKAVEHDSVSAMNNIATFYYQGWGVRRSYPDAARWFQVAADRGDPSAMNSLGVMYHGGTGVSQSHPTALKLFQRAAQQGYAPAMVNLGRMHASGHGVKKDNVQAYALLHAALSAGVPEDARDGVLYQLGMLAARLNEKQLARAQRLAEGISAVAIRRLQPPEQQPEAPPSRPTVHLVKDLHAEKDDAGKRADVAP
jgi:TPR repeat protein